MRISGKPSVGGSVSAGTARSAQAATPVSPAHSVAPQDAVSVSGAAQLIAVARAEIAQVPDIRNEKVEALRSAIDGDSYRPDGKAVAEGIVREHLPLTNRP